MLYLIKSYCDLNRLGFRPDNDTSERIANIGLPSHCLHNNNNNNNVSFLNHRYSISTILIAMHINPITSSLKNYKSSLVDWGQISTTEKKQIGTR